MPQETSLQDDNHLINNIFGGFYAFIELLYHLTHISLSYLLACHTQDNFPSVFTVILINCVNNFSLLSQNSQTVLVGKAMNITKHLTLQNG